MFHSDKDIFNCSPGGSKCPGADIAIIVDKSMSVGVNNFKIVKQFLTQFVEELDVSPAGDHIALLTFHQWVQVVFPLTRYLDKGSLVQAILRMPNMLAPETRTDRALLRVEQSIFTPSGGDRPNRKNYIIIFTDGRPWARNTKVGVLKQNVRNLVSRLEVRGFK